VTEATIIPLQFWQDPQGDVILIYSEAECSVYFACWADAGEPAGFIGHISFEHAAAVRSFARESLPYRIASHNSHSYILQVSDSDLVREHIAYRQSHYPHFPGREQQHFVVTGHDIYHEILATSFTARTIPNQDVLDPRLLRLISDS
jgi:hypothetical protein